MEKYKLNVKSFVKTIEWRQKKKIDNYVSFALEDSNDIKDQSLPFESIEHIPRNREKFFKKLDKCLKYEFICRVFDDYSVRKNSKEKDFNNFMKSYSKHMVFPLTFEIGLLTLDIKKKIYFVTIYHSTFETFFMFSNYFKFNKKPNFKKLKEVIDHHLKDLGNMEYEDVNFEFMRPRDDFFDFNFQGYPGKDIVFSKRFFNEQQIDNMFLRHKFFRSNTSPINIKLSNK
jgi:hypothetical protein